MAIEVNLLLLVLLVVLLVLVLAVTLAVGIFVYRIYRMFKVMNVKVDLLEMDAKMYESNVESLKAIASHVKGNLQFAKSHTAVVDSITKISEFVNLVESKFTQTEASVGQNPYRLSNGDYAWYVVYTAVSAAGVLQESSTVFMQNEIEFIPALFQVIIGRQSESKTVLVKSYIRVTQNQVNKHTALVASLAEDATKFN